MKRITLGASGLAIALTLGVATTPASAQSPYQLGPRPAKGLAVGPMFEGWWANPDGTYTLSFGYYNPNGEEQVEVPIGPDNFIEPAEFDGIQPTYFPPVNYGGYNGRRERGAFAITIPAEYADRDVVWTLRTNGKTERVPGRVTSQAYELTHLPMAMGSRPPLVGFDATGPFGSGPLGIDAPKTLTTRVGTPIEITVWANDTESDREGGAVQLGVNWRKHQGPGEVTFQPRSARIEAEGSSTGSTTASATFSAPGEYVVRIRVDNHRAPDSAPGDQCCWSNAFVRVNVSE